MPGPSSTARAALAASRDPGVHFRLLEPLALGPARQGRWHDAMWVLGYVDRLYALRGEVHRPFAQRRRAELDALLPTSMPERQALARRGSQR